MRQFTLIAGRAQVVTPSAAWERLARHLPFARAFQSGPPDSADARPGPRALPGATDEFEAFYREHAQAIFSYLWRVTGNEQTASDLTQEVFLRAWSQFAKVRGYDKPDAWLFHIATNLALDVLRRQRVAGPVLTPREDGRAVSDHAPRVVQQTALRAALDGLPARQRAALILRELYGYSCGEVAEALEATRAAAKMILSRARAQLRALYLKEDAE